MLKTALLQVSKAPNVYQSVFHSDLAAPFYSPDHI